MTEAAEAVLVAGVDSSTQSSKVVVCDARTGEIVREGRASHPDGTEVDPAAWWAAYEEAISAGLLDDVRAIAVAGQQHGMVAMDEDRRVVRKALLWNDTRSAGAAAELVRDGARATWNDWPPPRESRDRPRQTRTMSAAADTVLVAGVDSSTQSTKVVVCDARTGEIVREGRASHPDGTEVDPAAWWAAYEEATSAGLLDDVRAIAVAGQQHGMVALDEDRKVVRKALLWNDTRSAGAAADLVRELGGPQAWADAVGTVPLASITVAKLRWFV